jgi:hypothetical protein
MGVSNFQDIMNHVGHSISVVTYGRDKYGEVDDFSVDILNAAIECLDCNEVLVDFDKEDT